MDLAERHVLRGYDAVQLAAALKVHREYVAFGGSCTLVSADAELNSAALAEGLSVENPNDHP
jgi:predicted nucleic acid-binding protein